MFYLKGIGFFVPTVLNWCFLSIKGKTGHSYILLRYSNGQLGVLPKLVLFVHQREIGVLLRYFRGKLILHFSRQLLHFINNNDKLMMEINHYLQRFRTYAVCLGIHPLPIMHQVLFVVINFPFKTDERRDIICKSFFVIFMRLNRRILFFTADVICSI
jgi:hypothetical protein